MNKAVIAIIIVVAVLGTLCLVVAGIYNSLVSVGVAVDQSWSEVKNQYQRQADLIPNLVTVTKDYMVYEKSLLTNLTAARTAWLNAIAQGEFAQDTAGQQIVATTGQWIATVENYPDLKASTVVLDLMDELAGTQNRIAVARGRYIENIGSYNRAVQTFPSNVVAWMFNFHTRAYYQGGPGIETPPNATLGAIP